VKSFVRIRGRVKGRFEIAWLEAKGERTCSTDETSFEVETADGIVTCDVEHATQWKTWLRGGYSGPWKNIDEEVGEHPFRDRRDIDDDDEVHFQYVTLDDGLAIEAWGVPEYGPGASSYREAAGPLVRVAATRVERHHEHEVDDRPIGGYVLVLLALAFAGVAPFGQFVFSIMRCALVLGAFGVRSLHLAASPFEAPSKSIIPDVVRIPVWAYVVLGYLLPLDVPWIRLSAAIVMSAFVTRDAWVAWSRKPVIYDALLSREAVAGLLESGDVRTEEMTVRSEDVAVRWSDDTGDDHVTIAPLGSKWIVVQSANASHDPLARAQRWDRVMPFVYIAFAIASFALAWPRF